MVYKRAATVATQLTRGPGENVVCSNRKKQKEGMMLQGSTLLHQTGMEHELFGSGN